MAYPIVKQVQEQMGDRLRFVFRNFPLAQMHPHAKRAAEAAESAAAQGKFWEMHDTLYENQSDLSDTALVAYAEHIGLDEDRFARDLRSGKYLEKVEADFMSGVESGVNGTPTFYINGVRHDGSWQPGPLLEALESASSRSAGSAPM
jgi:protein-disulfide isomerase